MPDLIVNLLFISSLRDLVESYLFFYQHIVPTGQSQWDWMSGRKIYFTGFSLEQFNLLLM